MVEVLEGPDYPWRQYPSLLPVHHNVSEQGHVKKDGDLHVFQLPPQDLRHLILLIPHLTHSENHRLPVISYICENLPQLFEIYYHGEEAPICLEHRLYTLCSCLFL